MKKKALYTVLILAVLSIWVVIMYRIYSTYFDDAKSVSSTMEHNDQIHQVSYSYLDSFELELDYKDPFLKGYSMTPKMNNTIIHNSVIPKIKEKEPPKIEVLFPEIKYLGNMINASNNRIKAIVFINNKEYVISGGEEIEQLKIVKVKKEFIEVKKESEIRKYDLQTEK
jgi:hypothetical protein